MKPPRFLLVSVDDRLLHVQFVAVVKMEDYLSVFAAIRLLADEHSVKDILIDARAFRKKMSLMQRLQLAQALVDNFLGYRVAGVISAESFDPRLLEETMARNRGGNVKMTTSQPEALAWLGEKPPRTRAPAPAASGGSLGSPTE